MKKRIFCFAILLLLAIATSFTSDIYAAPLNIPTNPGSNGLISCWSLNEISGIRYDTYGSNHLTDNNTVGYATGIIGNAADFESENLEYLTGNDISLSSFTIAGWVNLESKSSDIVIANQNDAVDNNRKWQLYYSVSLDRFYFWVSSDGANVIGLAANNFGSPSLSTWYYVVATYSSGNSLTISINNGIVDSFDTSAVMNTNSVIYTVGARANTVTYYFDGLVDELILYSRILNDDEKTFLYNNGSGRACGDINPTPTPTATYTPTPTPVTPAITDTPTPRPPYAEATAYLDSRVTYGEYAIIGTNLAILCVLVLTVVVFLALQLNTRSRKS